MVKDFYKKGTENWLKMQKIKFCLCLILLAVLLVILVSQVFSDVQKEQDNYISLSNDSLDERMSSLYNELNNLPSGAGNDVLFLSNLVDVTDFAFKGSSERTQVLYKEFSEFLNQNVAYKKLTIIRAEDKSGLSVERQIDGKIIPNSFLDQSFLSENFLKEVLNLKKDKVYISDLQKDVMSDSNSLVLYYATPIFNGSEQMGGILILTVDPSYFLNDVRNFSRPGEQVFLVNESGGYLANSNINKEYINSGKEFGFKDDFSKVADEILSISDKRIIETSDSTFVFRYIQPTLSKFNVYKPNNNSDVQEIKDSFYWVLVSVSDRQNINVVLSAIKQQKFIFLLLMIIITLFIGVVVSSMNWKLINKIKSPRA